MRLITRPDLDGVASAVLITTMEEIEQVLFTEPGDIEAGTTTVNPGDAVANLPFHPNAALWFDHHDKAEAEPGAKPGVRGRRGTAPSASRLVFEYYDSPRLARFEEMVRETDRFDSADLTQEEVTDPQGWILLGFTLDPYMGLANFHGYANSIIAALRHGSNIAQVLDLPEVQGRVNRYRTDSEDFKRELHRCSRLEGSVLVTDCRDEVVMPTGNRFLAFSLYPEAVVQVVLTHHSAKDKVRVRIGKSIFNRSCPVHLGKLAAEYGGGGLDGSAGFLMDYSDSDARIADIIQQLQT